MDNEGIHAVPLELPCRAKSPTLDTARVLVGRRRDRGRSMTGVVRTRPMASDAEVHFEAALRRVAAALVESHLRGRRGEGQ